MSESITSAELLNKNYSEVLALHAHKKTEGFVALTLQWLADCRAAQKGIVWAFVISSDVYTHMLSDMSFVIAIDPVSDRHRILDLGHIGSIMGVQIYVDGYESPDKGNRLPHRTLLVVSTEETVVYNLAPVKGSL